MPDEPPDFGFYYVKPTSDDPTEQARIDQDDRTMRLWSAFNDAGFFLPPENDDVTVITNQMNGKTYPVSKALLDFTLDGRGSIELVVAEYVKAADSD